MVSSYERITESTVKERESFLSERPFVIVPGLSRVEGLSDISKSQNVLNILGVLVCKYPVIESTHIRRGIVSIGKRVVLCLCSGVILRVNVIEILGISDKCKRIHVVTARVITITALTLYESLLGSRYPAIRCKFFSACRICVSISRRNRSEYYSDKKHKSQSQK